MRKLAAAPLAFLLAGCIMPGGDDGGSGPGGGPPPFRLEPFLSGLDDPVFLTHAGDGSDRIFIVEQRGAIRVWDGTLQGKPFLDLHDTVLAGGERGLLGLAFHPEYAANGRFFVYYTAPGGDITIAEHRNTQPGDNEADATPGRAVITVEHSKHGNHNGGMLAFGPDGHLYAATGDGGSGGDPDNNAQDRDSLLGKVLRLDVDGLGALGYGIPEDNPFVGKDGRDEIWALGLRNPWRFSFDRGGAGGDGGGDLWIGDVGQNAWEEVNRARADEAGVNYGWSRFEATHLYHAGRTASGARDPVLEYDHDWGGGEHQAVTGGYVYRGETIPTLQGTYLFGDFASGFLWTFKDGRMAKAHDTDLLVSSFGEDEAGELYVVDLGGQVQKVIAP